MFIDIYLHRHTISPIVGRRLFIVCSRLRHLLLFCGFCLSFVAAASHPEEEYGPPKILVVTSGDSPVYDQVIDHLNKSLGTSCPDRVPTCLKVDEVVRASDERPVSTRRIINAQPGLLLTLGTRAAKSVAASQIKTPTLYALLPEVAFHALPECCQTEVSALFLDQSLDRQIRLISTALPDFKRLGVLFGPSSRNLQGELQGLAASVGLQLESEMVTSRKEVGSALKRLLRRSDLLLALPDPVAYGKQTVFNVLLSSYHSGVPVIGYSQGYVKAGALLAIHSTPQQIGQQLADIVSHYFASGAQHLPAPQYPTYFSVSINKNVARSFNIALPDEEMLRKRVKGERQ